MAKHIVLVRDDEGDWYKRAQAFLASNGSKPLSMELTDEDVGGNAFRQAVDKLRTLSGDEVELDRQAALITVSARMPEFEGLAGCECKCGTAYACGGGGGGA